MSLRIQTLPASANIAIPNGATGIIVPPPTQSSFGGIKGFIIEWLMFMQELLGLAGEHEVRDKLIAILPGLAELAK